MNEMLEEIAKIKRIITRLLQFATQERPTQELSIETVLRQIEQLTLHVAQDLNKKVRFEARLQSGQLPNPLLRVLRETLPQLIRNAVAHGIESAEERLRAGKPEEGTVRLMLDINNNGQLVIAVEDDGRGLNPANLRQRVIDKNLRHPDEVAHMSDQEITALIFEPGFSSLDEAGVHAGRGDGLSVVRHAAERLGAQLRISSRPSHYTRFALLFRDNRWLFA
jgi:chemotaxis protein histidine kinase CheA